MELEWDAAKALSNERKHGVTFHEAATAFLDPFAELFPDPKYMDSEDREILLGVSERGRLLLVSFTQRPPNLRIISARVATASERRRYENQRENTMSDDMNDDLEAEYEFDHSQAKPNRFAARLAKGGRLVVLDPEVAEVFRESRSVNAVLKALLHTMPKSAEPATVS